MQHRDDRSGLKQKRRIRVAVAGVEAPRVAVVFAVTRGAAALRRCTREAAVQVGILALPIFIVPISNSRVLRHSRACRRCLCLSLRALGRAEKLALVFSLYMRISERISVIRYLES